MFNVHQGKSLSEKIAHLNASDLQNTTWLVADLKSKSELQKHLLQRTACLPEDAVIRVSEFWQKLFHQIQPDFELVSSSLVTTYLAEWLASRDSSWADHPGTPKLLFHYIDFFLPILTRPELVERTREWLAQNPSALIRWGSWFELSNEAWQVFHEQKTIARPWASAFLSGLEREEWPWQRHLVLDLGADLTGVEADLLTQMAKPLNIDIYAPAKASREKYGSSLWPYSHLLSEKIQTTKTSTEIFSTTEMKSLNPKRFTSPLAEVKASANEIYEALKSGVAPHEIGIFAAQIEDYWPQLEAYLRVEGIPFAKNVVLAGVSLPSAARWVARLRVESQDISSGDLEQTIFGGAEATDVPLSYEKFAPLYNKIYEVEDLGRNENLRKKLEFKYASNERLGRDEFFDWALKFWEGDALGVDKVAAAIYQECPHALKLELRSWIRYVETLLPKIELTLREGQPQGIHVGNFDSAAHLSLKKVILLGLSESQLADQNEISVSHGDVIKIATDLGINLSNLGARSGAFWVEHLIRQSTGPVDMYFSATNSAGEPQTPSLLWLEVAAQKIQDIEKCVAPSHSRWDELQHLQVHTEDDSDLKKWARIDAGLAEVEKIKHDVPIKFSVSQIENYLQCPFVFTALKLLRLSDMPDVDLDIDNMTRGRLLHGALDKVLAEPIRLTWQRSELANIVDNLRDQLDVVLGFKELWPTQRERYVDIIERFLQFETEWRKEFAATKTVGREVAVRGELVLNENLKIKVTGKIDRVDTNSQGEFVILDYKSSGGGLRNVSSWLENNELQLLFYSMCVEEGLTELEKGPVIGAFYYILSNMTREKGFRDGSKVGTVFRESTRSRTHIERAELQKMFAQLKEKIAAVITEISDGQLNPKPNEHHICTTCAWKTVCRAQHLN
jgi:ATP-dependent helicase/nuclease subunit B